MNVSQRTKTQLCLALDTDDRGRARALCDATEEFVDVFKVGPTLFAASGPDLVSELAARRPVFLDLKLHDIPAQVAGAVRSARAIGARYVTVHASGGREMLAAASEAAAGDIAILAVTVLTNLDQRGLAEVGVPGPVDDQVVRLADLALGSGARGLVCSPLEVASLRSRFGARDEDGPLLVVPGIRAEPGSGDDQKRTLGAREVSRRGADIVVVGRPITASGDAHAAAAMIKAELT